MISNNQPLFGVKATPNSNVHTTTCASSRNVLTKTSDDVTIKSYFEGVHELLKTKGPDAFCVNLDEVWPLVYERKDHAIRHLTNGDYFEGVDFQASQNGKVVSINNLQNGINTTIMVTVPTLETLIARKERRVFEVYRQVFHQAMDNASSQPQQATIQDKMFFINAVSEGLRLNEPSRLALYKQVNDQHCLGLSLPSYTPSKGVLKSLTDCLKEVGSDFSAKKFYPVLETGGYVERKSRFTHDGSLKHFWSLTKKGLEWGENQVNPNNPRETQALFFVDKFVGLYEGLLK